VAAGDDFGIVWAFDVATGKRIAKVKASSYKVEEIAFSPNGRYLAATAPEDKSAISVYDVTQKFKLVMFYPRQSPAEKAEYQKSGDFRMLTIGYRGLSFSGRGTLIAFRVNSWVREFGLPDSGVSAGAMVSEGSLYGPWRGYSQYIPAKDALFALKSARDGKMVFGYISLTTLEPTGETVTIDTSGDGLDFASDYAISPDGSTFAIKIKTPTEGIALVSIDKKVIIAKIATPFWLARFSEDGTLLLERKDKSVLFFDAATGAEKANVVIGK